MRSEKTYNDRTETPENPSEWLLEQSMEVMLFDVFKHILIIASLQKTDFLAVVSQIERHVLEVVSGKASKTASPYIPADMEERDAFQRCIRDTVDAFVCNSETDQDIIKRMKSYESSLEGRISEDEDEEASLFWLSTSCQSEEAGTRSLKHHMTRTVNSWTKQRLDDMAHEAPDWIPADVVNEWLARVARAPNDPVNEKCPRR